MLKVKLKIFGRLCLHKLAEGPGFKPQRVSKCICVHLHNKAQPWLVDIFFAKTCLWPVQGWFPACTLLLEQAVNMGSQGPKEPKEKLEINELTCFFCTPNFTELVLGSRHFFLQKPVYGPPKAGFLHAPCSWNRRSTWGARGRRNQKRSLKSMS